MVPNFVHFCIITTPENDPLIFALPPHHELSSQKGLIFNFDGPQKSEMSDFQMAKYRDQSNSSSKFEICFGPRVKSFEARRLISWNLTLHLCLEGMVY